MDDIVSFTGEYRFLSNFFRMETAIFYGGYRWHHIEGPFQGAKDPFRIKEFVDLGPNEAKKLGRAVNLRVHWDKGIKDMVMFELLRLKFVDTFLTSRLLDTGDRKIVEGNTWHDNYWGNCTCPKCQSTQGWNMLGKQLMLMRDILSASGRTVTQF